MQRVIFLFLCLLQCTSLLAQRDYEMFALEEYKSDTVYMETYAYVCDTVAVFNMVNIYNSSNHPGRGDVKYKTGEPLADLYGFDAEHVLIPTELNNKMGAIVDNAFSEEQAASLNGEEFWVILNISSSTGEITDIYFSYDLMVSSRYRSIPISVFRAIELQLKEQIVFELTEEGRRLNYCYLAWTQCPTGYVAPTLDPDVPFDGGSGGEGNVQTGPRGSIITEPMVPPK